MSFEKIGKGSHTIVVEAAGYNAIMMPLTTTGEPVVEVKPVLKRVAGKLMVTSEPSGAAIVLDGKPTEQRTPATFELEGDSVHEIRLTLKDYKELSKAPVRVEGGTETIEKLVLKPSTVHIRVFSTPEGASVKVGDIDFGLTPADIERAPDEPYPQVVFTKPGCETLTTTVPFDREKAEDRFEVNLKCK